MLVAVVCDAAAAAAVVVGGAYIRYGLSAPAVPNAEEAAEEEDVPPAVAVPSSQEV